jgi:hypothetical protein
MHLLADPMIDFEADADVADGLLRGCTRPGR